MNCALEYNRPRLDSFNPAYKIFTQERFKECASRDGRVIFHQGSMPTGIYYIKSGKVKITRMSENEVRNIIQVGTEGDFVGYEDVLLGRKYSNTAEAWNEVILNFIPTKDFLEILDRNPRIFRKFSKCFIRTHSN